MLVRETLELFDNKEIHKKLQAFNDIGHLLAIMNRLVKGGNTVVVIEDNLDIIRNVD